MSISIFGIFQLERLSGLWRPSIKKCYHGEVSFFSWPPEGGIAS